MAVKTTRPTQKRLTPPVRSDGKLSRPRKADFLRRHLRTQPTLNYHDLARLWRQAGYRDSISPSQYYRIRAQENARRPTAASLPGPKPGAPAHRKGAARPTDDYAAVVEVLDSLLDFCEQIGDPHLASAIESARRQAARQASRFQPKKK